jgi:hypothetical protein
MREEERMYADVALPFHVWVRERHGPRGARWVLREASHLREDPGVGASAGARGGLPPRPGEPAA